MLLGYGGRNCWCFKEWIDINLRLNGHVPEKFSSNKSFSLITGFFGANASGKTSALKIYAFISYFITNSFSSAKESPIFYDSFFDNKDNSEFYVEFTDANYPLLRSVFLFSADQFSTLSRSPDLLHSDHSFFSF